MTASPPTDPNFTPSIGLAEAIYFRSGDHLLFGWIHQASCGTESRTGLVLCQPFGYESVCSHRSMRSFADAAATLGLPTLRFDYLGTGDSADIDPDADQLDCWSQDIIAAIAELQRRTGVERVCLLGFRLGAVLASLVANQCKAVSALILVAPFVSGRRYLSELRTTRLASAVTTDPDKIANTSSREGSMEVCGFSLSAASIKTLAQTELARVPAAHISHILVIDRSDLPAARVWAEALSGNGVRTQYLALPGFVQMMMTPPQFAVVPQAMIGAMHDWLSQLDLDRCGQSDRGIGRQRQSIPAKAPATLSLPGCVADVSARLTERPVAFGSSAVLFGIVTEPRQDAKQRGAVILLNSGAEYHIGTNRMYVSLARRWARGGFVVLRMDLAGLGDSSTPREQADDEIFPPSALEDIRAGVEYLRTRYGDCDITIAGQCSGAYHALRAAVGGLPLIRILMVNPQNFFWDTGSTLEDLQLAEVVRNPVVYRERVLSARAWKRLLTGEVNVWRLVAVFIHRFFLTLESVFRDIARQIGFRLPRDLGRELEEIGARGVDIIFVFSRGDPGIDLLKLQAGSSIRRLGKRLRVHIVDGADHNFSHKGPRELMERLLCDELFVENDWTAAVPKPSPSSPMAVTKLGT